MTKVSVDKRYPEQLMQVIDDLYMKCVVIGVTDSRMSGRVERERESAGCQCIHFLLGPPFLNPQTCLSSMAPAALPVPHILCLFLSLSPFTLSLPLDTAHLNFL